MMEALARLLHPLRPALAEGRIPLGEWISALVDWLLAHAQWLFDVIVWLIDGLTTSLEILLLAPPAWLLAALIVALAAWRVNWRFALFALAALALVLGLELWRDTLSTLALVLAATVVSLVIGVPVGIWAARSDRVWNVVRPVLDFMQTMPAFVYLIPAVMFFSTGKVPGTIATIIFAMPPAVRLTNLGIRQVSREMVEAGLAFGCTPRQLLFKVQIPAALPSIMAGVNQNIMLALSMVVIASMIGAGGLGDVVLRGIQRLDVGLGFEGGIGVVVLAIILDRITQSFGQRRRAGMLERLRELFGLSGNNARGSKSAGDP
ncbi:proline/glycine betaine ABC transporter permease [Thiohalophilus sp.]|uniref:ABC transporter permease n=1 Tax=Thiohalophilus sp. TaxID=3028392 RepID=UPI002ACD5AA8|nr:proline/glycine betaine ABC transporter permease [Thiohalophilus sp.]MDZ7663370.1 proline/glycine betaine ABC transporter permease [Thiohalophilus sp.]